jgi:hypothetical protein
MTAAVDLRRLVGDAGYVKVSAERATYSLRVQKPVRSVRLQPDRAVARLVRTLDVQFTPFGGRVFPSSHDDGVGCT